MRDPVPEIDQAAHLLDDAVTAHLNGNRSLAKQLILDANLPAIRDWTESLWGANSPYAPKKTTTSARGDTRHAERMPSSSVCRNLHLRDGYHCRFCGIPVIRTAVRKGICKAYPELNIWGRRNVEQHAAFQAMWAQYDHVVPHSAGGGSDFENLIVTCAPCNYSRMECTLEQSGLADPRQRVPRRSAWDGLERFIGTKKQHLTPVWVTFPDIPWRSIGWRMGYGEEYWYLWKAWYTALPAQARTKYQETWPEPDAWRGFYAGIETEIPKLALLMASHWGPTRRST